MITLTLLHPTKPIPLQHWTFETESVIRIGRGMDNHVVLYSAVVSRHHLDIKKNGLQWELESFGANGTFIGGNPVTKTPIDDGMIIRLASSGPQIQIRILPDKARDQVPATQAKYAVFEDEKDQTQEKKEKDEKDQTQEKKEKESAKETMII